MKEPLTHHEQLRFDYLLKNYHYLSEKQQAEFNYLKAKQEAFLATNDQASSFSQPTFDQPEETDYPYPLQEEEDLTIQGLPVYPAADKPKKSFDQVPLYEPKVTQPEAASQPKPPKTQSKGGGKKILKVLGLVLLLTFLGMLIMFFKGIWDISSGNSNYSPAVTEVFNGVDTADGTNILVLGSDQRITQGSSETRTDTIMVVNVGNSDGKIKMVSFMRDTLVNIAGVSGDSYSNDVKLNAAFSVGEQEGNQGAELMRQTLKANFDIDIKYYVMVDFQTFAEAIDTLFPEGVSIDAQFSTVDGVAVSQVEVPDDLGFANGGAQFQTIAVGQQTMDGKTLLNYARFRSDDLGDYGRTQRQQQVLGAILSQIKDPTKLFTGSAAIGKIYALTSTNISFPFIASNGLSVITSGQAGVDHITVPEYGDWVDQYDQYGGLGLGIDFVKYQEELANLGLR